MGKGGVFLRKLRARVADQPSGFVWIEKGKLAGSGYPASRSQVEWISSQGVDVILTLTEKPLPADWAEGLPLTLKHIPMMDHLPPDTSSLEQAATFVQEQMNQGRTVLVHCLAGEGRTGCVLAAYLIKDKRINADEAIAALRKVKPAFVEGSQEKAVRAYEAGVKP